MNLVLGSESMIGRQICNILPDCVGISHKYYDLTDILSCYDAFKGFQFRNVIHLAGFNGGIGLNLSRGADIFHTTSLINLNVLKCCQLFKVDKVISVLASCSYPDLKDKVLEESDIFKGECNSTVASHGMAKRLLLSYSRELNKQYGLKTICPILTNCYGPGDRFSPERTKVVGAAVKKICDAKINNTPSITFWGTGNPLREIMHCRDAATCLTKLLTSYDDYQNPINIGSDQEISIRDLVSTIARLCEYYGAIVWDTDKPDGQMRKKLSTAKMKDYISHDMTPLEEGLRETIKYYLEVGQHLER